MLPPRVTLLLVVCALLSACMAPRAAALADAAPAPIVSKEVARTAEGNYVVWYHAPATEADLGLPIYPTGTVTESWAYRVRNRKDLDLLFLARVRVTSRHNCAALRKFYLAALGAGATQHTDKRSGEITLAAGETDHFRLVVITPTAQGCTAQLEQVQQFTLPPRAYSPVEQRVLNVLATLAQHYGAAPRVAYTMEQRSVASAPAAPDPPPPALTWQVNLTRPASLTVTAQVGDTVALRITTAQRRLHIHRQLGGDTVRPLSEPLSTDSVPELADDPVATLMLGGTLLNPQLDYLTMQAVKGLPTDQQDEIILTYPDEHSVLRLFVDVAHTSVLRAETVVTDGQQSVTTTRTYTAMTVLAAPARQDPK